MVTNSAVKVSVAARKGLIPLDRIREAIFADAPIAARIRTDYGVEGDHLGPALEGEVIRRLEQIVVADPAALHPSDSAVFRAAVRALGSNSRAWTRYLKAERGIERILRGFDPAAAARLPEDAAERISAELGGFTGNRDAAAMRAWGTHLVENPDYYRTHLLRARERVIRVAREADLDLHESEVTVITAHLTSRPGNPQRPPGMGSILASEFLRNLGWTGFKADRHVKRLFCKWYGLEKAPARRAVRIAAQFSEYGSADLPALYFAVVGTEHSPGELPVSQVDNLVWLFGAYVDKARYSPKGARCSLCGSERCQNAPDDLGRQLRSLRGA